METVNPNETHFLFDPAYLPHIKDPQGRKAFRKNVSREVARLRWWNRFWQRETGLSDIFIGLCQMEFSSGWDSLTRRYLHILKKKSFEDSI